MTVIDRPAQRRSRRPASPEEIVDRTSIRLAAIVDRFVARHVALSLRDRTPARRNAPGVHPVVLDPDALAAAVARTALAHRLSTREAHVLAAAVHGVPRGRIAEALDLGENTVKTYVRKLLDKLDERSLEDAVWMVRLEVAAAVTRGGR